MILYEANVTLLLHGINLNKLNQVRHREQVQNVVGFAKVYSYGTQDDFNFMAMELLGPSLADLFQFCGYKFSLKTTLMIMV